MAPRPSLHNHYVPRAYLARFTDTGDKEDGRLWMHDRDTDEVHRTGTRNVGAEHGLYADGRDDWFERWLAETVDAWGAELVDELLQPNANFSMREHPRVNPEKRQKLSLYLLLQQLRVPGAREEMAAVGQRAHERRRATGKMAIYDMRYLQRRAGTDSPEERWLLSTPLARLREALRKGDLDGDDAQQRHWIMTIPFVATTMLKAVMTAKWHIAPASPAEEFVTSDAPVVTVRAPTGATGTIAPFENRFVGVWSGDHAVTYFPLSPQALLVVRPGHHDVTTSDHTLWVAAINRLIVQHSERFFFARGSRRDLLETVLPP